MQSFGSRTDTVFCGVFDGHGPYGHMVAKRVRDNLPLKLSAYWEDKVPVEGSLKTVNNSTSGINNNNSEDAASFVSTEEEPRPENTESELFQTLKEAFLKAFKVVDRELKFHGSVDCFCSGTTAVTLIKQVLSQLGSVAHCFIGLYYIFYALW